MAAVNLFQDPILDSEMEMALVTAIQQQKSSLLLTLLNKQNGYRVFKSLCLRGVWKESDTESGQDGGTKCWLFRTFCSNGPHLVDLALLVAVTQDMFDDALRLLERGSGKMQGFVKSQLMSKSDWYFLSMHLSPHLTDKEKKEAFLQAVRKGDFRKASVVCRFPGVLSHDDLCFLGAVSFHVGGLEGVASVSSIVKPRHVTNAFTILKSGLRAAAGCIIGPICNDALTMLLQEISCCQTFADVSQIVQRLMKRALDASVVELFLGLCVECKIPKPDKDRGRLWPSPAEPAATTSVLPENMSLANILGFLAELSFRLDCETERKLDPCADPESDFDLLRCLIEEVVECGGEAFLLKCCRSEAGRFGMEANRRRLVCTAIRLLFGSCDDDTFRELARCHESCSQVCPANCLIHCAGQVATAQRSGMWIRSCPRLEQWVKGIDHRYVPFVSHGDTNFCGWNKRQIFAEWCSNYSFPNLSLFVSLAWRMWAAVTNARARKIIYAQPLCVTAAQRAAQVCKTVLFLLFLRQIEDRAVVQAILQEHRNSIFVFTSLCDDDLLCPFRRTLSTDWKSFDILLEHQHLLADHVIAKIVLKAADANEWWLVKGLFGRCAQNEELTSDLLDKVMRQRERTVAEWLIKCTDTSTLKKCSLINTAIYSDGIAAWAGQEDGHMVSWCIRMGLASLHHSGNSRCPLELALSDGKLPLARLLYSVGTCPSPALCFQSSRYSAPLTEEELVHESEAEKQERQQVQDFLSQITRQPRSLHDICRLRASEVIGFGSERVTRAKALGLPSRLVSEVLSESAVTEYEASQVTSQSRYFHIQ